MTGCLLLAQRWRLDDIPNWPEETMRC